MFRYKIFHVFSVDVSFLELGSSIGAFLTDDDFRHFALRFFGRKHFFTEGLFFSHNERELRGLKNEIGCGQLHVKKNTARPE